MSALMENSITDWISAFFFAVMAVAFAFSVYVGYKAHRED